MVDAAAISDLIRKRRTIKPKQFSDREVEDAQIRMMLENANWAPTHGMTEPWRFTVFRGESRRRLADFLAETYRSLCTPDAFKQNKYEGMRENAVISPVVIAIGMKRQASEKISELDELHAVACAVQNLHLTAAALGLGGFWSTNVAATSDPMREFLGMDEKDRALGLFYVGYPSCDWPSGNRTPVDEKVQWLET